MATTFTELTGNTFGSWLVIGQSFFKGHRRYHYCKCQMCKTTHERRIDSLLSGQSNKCKQCADLLTTTRNVASATHGESQTPLHKLWGLMKRRVKDPEKNYLKLGIQVCKEWADSYEMFRDWALANGYDESLTIERNDPRGNYEPSNCTFITNKEQQANKLNTIRLPDGSMAWDLAQSNGITRAAFDKRIKLGWCINKVCTHPLRKTNT